MKNNIKKINKMASNHLHDMKNIFENNDEYALARFQPYNIRGWFWASTLQGMGDTNVFNGRKVSNPTTAYQNNL